jgi:MFS family permease
MSSSPGDAVTTPPPNRAANRRPLHTLLIANGISGFGNEMAALAVPWFVLQTTGNPRDVGLAAFAMLVPYIIATFVGGSIVDRLGFRRMSVVADIASGVTVALIPLLHLTVGLNLATLLALVFLGTLLDAPGITARQSMIPEISAMAHLPLERSNSVFESVLQFKNFLGPLIAGILIAATSASLVLAINAASFAVSALLIAVGVPSIHINEEERAPGARAALSRTLAGIRYIREDPVLLWLAIMSMISNLRIAPLFLVIMPVYADQIFDSPVGLGIALAAFGGTAFVGALAFGAFARRVPRRVWYLLVNASAATGFCILVGLPGLIGATLAIAFIGVTSGAGRPFSATIRQERTPIALRGRVFGANLALIELASPLGVLIASWMLVRTDLRFTLAVVAAIGLAQVTAIATMPTFREANLSGQRGDSSYSAYNARTANATRIGSEDDT